jgi:hypothetical protein
VVATNTAGPTNGGDLTFTTAACVSAPTVTTGVAGSLTSTGATLNGTVSSNGAITTVTFQYGLTTGYGSTATAAQSPLAAGASSAAVSAAVTSLTCNTLYHFRAVGANSAGTTNGGDQTFTTASCGGPPPTVATNAASGISTVGATLNGTISSNGASTTVTFQYGPTTSYGSIAIAAQSPLAAGASGAAVSAAIAGLNCGSTYHFRAVGSSGNGTTNGGDAAFATQPCGSDDNFPPGGLVPAGWATAQATDAGWIVTSDSTNLGPFSLKSATITDSQIAGIEVTGTFLAGDVSFAARVSSEADYDYFEFYVDGALEVYGSGEVDWTPVSVAVPAGTHTFTWIYIKDDSFAEGSDAAWIDGVKLPPTGARAPIMVVPDAAQTASYSTEAFVRNDYAEPITLDVLFYEANNSSVPGQRPCTPFTVPANATRGLALGSQCTLGTGSHFGMLILDDVAGTHDFTVFSRTQTPAGVGFSVEGTALETFAADAAFVEGLKRSATGPKYLSNCFVASLGSAVDYRIDLLDQNDATIGGPITGSLLPNRIIRYLDVLAMAGAPAGDYTDVRAKFTQTGTGTPPFIGFCTMQESVTFAADFRIAKPVDRGSTRMVVPIMARTASYGTEVYLRNSNAVAITVDVKFYEANNSSVPGPRPCTSFAVPANATRQLTPATQCTLGAGNHFGMLVLSDLAEAYPFTVFSRTQTPQGTGFSVEGFPAASFGMLPTAVEGLRRTATAPNYLANCFVGALGGALDYRIDLMTSDGVPIGLPLTGSLGANQIYRYLDVLALASAPAGDYSGVRAKFTELGPGTTPMVGFCTVQESVTFGADFRIAK